MTTRWRRAERRRLWHNQQNCIKGDRHKKRTALLVYPFKSRSAASVSASAAPDALRPLFCWNLAERLLGFCRNRRPRHGNPAAISALCSPFTASPESPICISPIRPANIVSIPWNCQRVALVSAFAAGAVQNPKRVRLHDNADMVVVAAVGGGGVSARQGVSLCARFMRAENEFAAPELPRAAQGIQIVVGVARRPFCAGAAAPLSTAAANRADDQPDAVAVAVRAVAPQSVARISRLNRGNSSEIRRWSCFHLCEKATWGAKKTEQPQKPLRHQFTLDYASTRKA